MTGRYSLLPLGFSLLFLSFILLLQGMEENADNQPSFGDFWTSHNKTHSRRVDDSLFYAALKR